MQYSNLAIQLYNVFVPLFYTLMEIVQVFAQAAEVLLCLVVTGKQWMHWIFVSRFAYNAIDKVLTCVMVSLLEYISYIGVKFIWFGQIFQIKYYLHMLWEVNTKLYAFKNKPTKMRKMEDAHAT